ncbi:MAG: sensor histidine kinase [Alkaliphilus sp.]
MKKKILLSYIILILVPYLLFSIAGFFIMHEVRLDINQEFGQVNFEERGINNYGLAPKGVFEGRIKDRFLGIGARSFLLYTVIHLVFISYVTRLIIKPLGEMKTAVNAIRDNKLDFEIEYEGKDEIGEVFLAFDEMRLQLKESKLVQKQYEKNRKNLIANISHDLKTPITAIKGYADGVIDKVANTPEKVEKYCRTIRSNAENMDSLINELVMLSKLDVDKIDFKYEEVNLVKYLRDCFEDWQYIIESDDMLFSVEFNDIKEAKVSIDREHIKRVMNNIIVNAVNYLNKINSKIEIVLVQNSSDYIISIKDNGAGIQKDKIEYIFDRFYRSDDSRNKPTEGSGLGLTIAKEIVEAHGGKIWVESDLGVGTSISFSLRKTEETI